MTGRKHAAQRIGYASWHFGAQKGVYQPPYVVRWYGRWYRTLPLTAATPRDAITETDLLAVRALDPMPFGARRCMDHLIRTGQSLRDLPLWKPK